MTLHQEARKLAKKTLRKCGLIWSSDESRYIEIIAQALMEFRKETLKETARIAKEYANNNKKKEI